MKTENYNAIRNWRGGFTLIELSIVIMIIGIFIGSITQLLTGYMIKKQQIDLEKTISGVQKGLRNFISAKDSSGATNARYPCPAPLTASPSSPEYGKEQREGDPADPGLCLNVPGVTQVTGTDGQKVFIGAVPFRTIGIEQKSTLDPWKNRLTYAVSAGLALNGQPLWGTNTAVRFRLNRMMLLIRPLWPCSIQPLL